MNERLQDRDSRAIPEQKEIDKLIFPVPNEDTSLKKEKKERKKTNNKQVEREKKSPVEASTDIKKNDPRACLIIAIYLAFLDVCPRFPPPNSIKKN